MASRVLGFVLEDTEGTENVTDDEAVTLFGLLNKRDEAHPMTMYALEPLFQEDTLDAVDLAAGSNYVKFKVKQDYVHAWPFLLAMGKVEDLGGGIYRISFGTKSANPIPSFTVYSQLGSDVLVVRGCKVKELNFHGEWPQPGEKPENFWFEMEIWGISSNSHNAITADPQAAMPTDLGNPYGKGFDMVPVKTYNGHTLSNLTMIHVQIINQLSYHGAFGESRDPRGIVQDEGTIVMCSFENTLDFTANDLLAVARATWAVGATNNLAFKVKFDAAATTYHTLNFNNLRIIVGSAIKSAKGADVLASIGKPMYDGTNKSFYIDCLDGSTYAL